MKMGALNLTIKNLEISDGRTKPGCEVRRTLDQTQAQGTQNDVVLDCFPQSRQILSVPLWDSANMDYASACFAVSEREVRVFTTATEVAFVRAFINSLTVGCGPISANLGEQQKGDFISSMSHV